MLYAFYEWNHAVMAPLRAVADATRALYQNPLNPLSNTDMGRTVAAMAEVFERSTRVYAKPEWGLHDTFVDGMRVPVIDKVVWEKPFGRLLHFERELPATRRADPRFLIVAPMSGHYATLLRGTVEALLPYGDVHITDWQDARMVPVAAGRFDLDDYVDYVIEMLRFLGPDTHVIGVCQPAVPVMMAVARMEEDEDPCSPATMTLMGGPIDTRINPTGVNRLAEEKGIDWFRQNVIMKVPFPQPGFMRDVYPGFLQLTGFMSMNLDRHLIAHKDFFVHLVKDDGDSAEKHRTFYDEYNAVMDLTAEFYLQTVDEVFIKHSLPKGEITHRGHRLDMGKIRRTALLTVEGENDDISGVGQTRAAQTLCTALPDDMRVHYMQPKVGHYGVFNGSRFRAEIAPRIVDFALTHGGKRGTAQPPLVPVPDFSAEARDAALQPPEALDAAPTQPTVFVAVSEPEVIAEVPSEPAPEAFVGEAEAEAETPASEEAVEAHESVDDAEAVVAVEPSAEAALEADTALVPPVLEPHADSAVPLVFADLQTALADGAEPVPSILPEGFLETVAPASPTIKGSPKLVKAATRPRRKR